MHIRGEPRRNRSVPATAIDGSRRGLTCSRLLTSVGFVGRQFSFAQRMSSALTRSGASCWGKWPTPVSSRHS